MVRWYKYMVARCPTCGQKLAVEAGQVVRGEIVTCQDCNSDLCLVQKGADPPAAVAGADEPPPIPLYLTV